MPRSSVLSIGLASVLGKGLEGRAQGKLAGEARNEAREVAKFNKAKMDAELRQINKAEEQGLMEQQLATAMAASKAANNKIMRMESYNFFDAYAIDDDPKHINNALQTIPGFKGLVELGFGGPVASAQRLDLSSDSDMRLLAKEEGITPDKFEKQALNLDNVKARYLKIIGADGSQRILDVADDVYATTGYFSHKTKQAQEAMLAKMKIDKLTKGTAPGELEKTATFVSKTTGRDIKNVTEKLFQDKVVGNVAGQIGEAASTEDKVVSAMGIDPKVEGKLEQFLQVDMTDTKNVEKLTSLVPALERLSKENMDSRQKKAFETVAAGISSAQSASDLEEPSTGLLDTPLDKMSAYIKDNLGADEVKQKEARNAYFSLRNTLRHAISGASLTNAEIKSFNEAYGTLAQQLPAVLAGLVVQLRQTKGQLAAIAQSGNPYAMHYRIGATRQNLDQIISQVDQRLSDFGSEEAQIGSVMGKVQK